MTSKPKTCQSKKGLKNKSLVTLNFDLFLLLHPLFSLWITVLWHLPLTMVTSLSQDYKFMLVFPVYSGAHMLLAEHLCMTHVFLDGSLHCYSRNWYFRVFRHQQLHLSDACGGERGERAHSTRQPWTGFLSRSSKCSLGFSCVVQIWIALFFCTINPVCETLNSKWI